MEDNGVKVAKNKTTGGEWIVIGIIVLIVIIAIVVVYLVYVPQLFQGSSVVAPTPPNQNPTICPTSSPPVNFTAVQNDLTEPTMDVAWDAVLITNTPGEMVLGYNIYLSNNPGITDVNKQLKTFSQVPQKRLRGLDEATTYYFKVSTVDTCGTGELSTEEGTFTTA